MRTLKTSALIALIAVLTACAPGISSGTIIDKRHKDAWVQTTFVQQCTGYRNGICSGWITVPRYLYWPEAWKFHLATDTDEGWLNVSSVVYNKYEVGDYYEKAER